MPSRVTTEQYGEWACVVGGANGLGLAFCEALADQGFNLLIADNDSDALANTNRHITKDKNVGVEPLCIDLRKDSAASVVHEKMNEKGCRFLVYNAAYGPVKSFLSNTAEDFNTYHAVNITTMVSLVSAFINHNHQQKTGLLLLSSLAGFRGTQLVVPYAATKAYIWNFAEGLYYEFRDTKLDISVCCPGATNTPNFIMTAPSFRSLSPKPADPTFVAQEAIRQFGEKLFIIPGRFNRLIHFFFSRILPRRLASGLHNEEMGKMYARHKA